MHIILTVSLLSAGVFYAEYDRPVESFIGDQQFAAICHIQLLECFAQIVPTYFPHLWD
jgi:hypothetical protein